MWWGTDSLNKNNLSKSRTSPSWSFLPPGLIFLLLPVLKTFTPFSSPETLQLLLIWTQFLVRMVKKCNLFYIQITKMVCHFVIYFSRKTLTTPNKKDAFTIAPMKTRNPIFFSYLLYHHVYFQGLSL